MHCYRKIYIPAIERRWNGAQISLERWNGCYGEAHGCYEGSRKVCLTGLYSEVPLASIVRSHCSKKLCTNALPP